MCEEHLPSSSPSYPTIQLLMLLRMWISNEKCRIHLRNFIILNQLPIQRTSYRTHVEIQ